MAEERNTLKPGDVFRVKDKQGNDYYYLYICKCPEEGTDREYLLYNRTLDVYTSVEKEWIKQRQVQKCSHWVDYYVLLKCGWMLHCWSAKTYAEFIRDKRNGEPGDVDRLLKYARIFRLYPCSEGDAQALQKARQLLARYPGWAQMYKVSSCIIEGKVNPYKGRL